MELILSEIRDALPLYFDGGGVTGFRMGRGGIGASLSTAYLAPEHSWPGVFTASCPEEQQNDRTDVGTRHWQMLLYDNEWKVPKPASFICKMKMECS